MLQTNSYVATHHLRNKSKNKLLSNFQSSRRNSLVNKTNNNNNNNLQEKDSTFINNNIKFTNESADLEISIISNVTEKTDNSNNKMEGKDNNINNNNKNKNNNSYNFTPDPNLTKEQIDTKLQKIFISFSKINERDQIVIKSKSIMKIMKICNVLDDNRIKYSDLDIIMKKMNLNENNTYNFTQSQFFNIIVKLSKKYFKDELYNLETAKVCLSKFVSLIFHKVSGILSNDIQTIDKLFNKLELTSNEGVILILKDVLPTLKEIYSKYFYFEININKNSNNNFKERNSIKKKSYDNLKLFLKEFEVLPYIISENFIFHYFNNITQSISDTATVYNQKEENNLINKMFLTENNSYKANSNSNESKNLNSNSNNYGIIFKFSKFLLLLLHLSYLNFHKFNSFNEIPLLEKLLLFLEKLQNSAGFKSFLYNKHCKPVTSSITLIPNIDTIKSIDLINYHNHKFLKSKEELKYNERSDTNLRQILTVNESNYCTLMKFSKELQNIFCYYSENKLTTGKINFSHFVKFIKDMNVHSNYNNFSKNNEKEQNNFKQLDYKYLLEGYNNSTNDYCNNNIKVNTKSLNNENNLNIKSASNNSNINNNINSYSSYSLNNNKKLKTLSRNSNQTKSNNKILQSDNQSDNSKKLSSVNLKSNNNIPKTSSNKTDTIIFLKKLLTESDINIIFSSCLLSNSAGMDFNHFIKSFELITSKIYSCSSETFNKCFSEFLENVK